MAYSCAECPPGGQCAACAQLEADAPRARAMWLASLSPADLVDVMHHHATPAQLAASETIDEPGDLQAWLTHTYARLTCLVCGGRCWEDPNTTCAGEVHRRARPAIAEIVGVPEAPSEPIDLDAYMKDLNARIAREGLREVLEDMEARATLDAVTTSNLSDAGPIPVRTPRANLCPLKKARSDR